MKDFLKFQIGNMRPGKKGWDKFKHDCIYSGICPQCGSDISPVINEKNYKEAELFGCSKCNWQNYKQIAFKSTDRHGLV
jgi:hypothetical protein